MKHNNITNKHIGLSVNASLVKQGILRDVEKNAAKRTVAHQLHRYMKEQNLNKSEMAKHMNITRSALDRLLDPENVALSFKTLVKVAEATEKRLHIEFVS